MKLSFRLSMVVFLLGVPAVLAALAPTWVGRMGRDAWRTMTLFGTFEGERRRSDVMDEELGRTLDRLAVREQVAMALVEGRLSLAEATAWFRYLNTDLAPGSRAYLQDLFADYPKDEFDCRHAIHYATATVATCGDDTEALQRRLAAELRRLPDRHGRDVVAGR